MPSILQFQILKEQKIRLMTLKENPLRIMNKISLVSCEEGIPGIQELIQNIEIMAVDKALFPNAQKQVPPEWEGFRASLKQEQIYCFYMDRLEVRAFCLLFNKNMHLCININKYLNNNTNVV